MIIRTHFDALYLQKSYQQAKHSPLRSIHKSKRMSIGGACCSTIFHRMKTLSSSLSNISRLEGTSSCLSLILRFSTISFLCSTLHNASCPHQLSAKTCFMTSLYSMSFSLQDASSAHRYNTRARRRSHICTCVGQPSHTEKFSMVPVSRRSKPFSS